MDQPNENLALRKAERKALDDETRILFERGLACYHADEIDEAIRCLRSARERALDHAQIRSALGLALAREGRDFEGARELCESAVAQEFFNPDLYLNLAQIYLQLGRRPEALRHLRRGQMIDPGHAEIGKLLVDLGRRRMPVVPFLPRRHPVNRALGGARKLILSSLFDRGVA